MYDFPQGDWIFVRILWQPGCQWWHRAVGQGQWCLPTILSLPFPPPHISCHTFSSSEARVTGFGQWTMNRNDPCQFLPKDMKFPSFSPLRLSFCSSDKGAICSTQYGCYMAPGSAWVWALLTQAGLILWERINFCCVKPLKFYRVYWSIS